MLAGTTKYPVGAAEGCDLLILILKSKRSQPSAAPTGAGGSKYAVRLAPARKKA